ncbi:hypothetical protein [Streptomyces adustus]|uniref:hypothetical protein n=1 Tax=Streptomyces adustus TaxID=1609272 RepID=UPI003717BA51
MGAFARLLRRSKATEEAGRESAAAEERTEAAATGPEVAAPVGSAGADGDAGATVADPVEIPKQPSAEDAAHRAAGEGARRQPRREGR